MKVWVRGYHERIVRPAVYEKVYDPETCSYVEVLVKPRRVRLRWVPGYYVMRKQRVWVPAPRVCSL